jgi:ribosome biogenesis protein Tsr3
MRPSSLAHNERSRRSSRARSLPGLPIQAPTNYQRVIKLNTAKALGLEVPATVLTRADKVIE